MQTLKDALNLEKSVSDMLAKLKSQLVNDVYEAKQDGVRMINSNCAVVSLSSINRLNLSPSYYIQSSQATVIEDKLKYAKTATEFVEWLQTMVEEGRIKKGSDVIQLNPKTIEVLKSYLENV